MKRNTIIITLLFAASCLHITTSTKYIIYRPSQQLPALPGTDVYHHTTIPMSLNPADNSWSFLLQHSAPSPFLSGFEETDTPEKFAAQTYNEYKPNDVIGSFAHAIKVLNTETNMVYHFIPMQRFIRGQILYDAARANKGNIDDFIWVPEKLVKSGTGGGVYSIDQNILKLIRETWENVKDTMRKLDTPKYLIYRPDQQLPILPGIAAYHHTTIPMSLNPADNSWSFLLQHSAPSPFLSGFEETGTPEKFAAQTYNEYKPNDVIGSFAHAIKVLNTETNMVYHFILMQRFIRGQILYDAARANKGNIDDFVWVPENMMKGDKVGGIYPIDPELLNLISETWKDIKDAIKIKKVAPSDIVNKLDKLTLLEKMHIDDKEKFDQLKKLLNESSTTTRKSLLLKYHPDKHPGVPADEADFYKRVTQLLNALKGV